MRPYLIYTSNDFSAGPPLESLRRFTPVDPSNFYFSIDFALCADPKGEGWVFHINVLVCSPNILAERAQRDPVFNGWGYIVMREYDPDLLYEYVENHLADCTGDTWDEVLLKASRLGVPQD